VAKGHARSGAGRDGWPEDVGSRWWEAERWSLVTADEASGVRRAQDDPQSNKRMHATRDTAALMLRGSCGRARDAGR